MATPARNLCVLFADVSGSSRLYEKLGDAEALRAVERCLNRIERAVVAHKGRVIKALGDELMVAFDGVDAAVQAAGDMHQRIDALPPVSGVSLAIRVGLHWGAAIEENGDLFGDTVNVAARMVALAKAGQILTTGEVVAALPASLLEQTREIDGLSVKGKDEPVRVFEVLWERGEDLTMKASLPPPVMNAETRLRLRHGDQETILGPERPTVTLGRDSHADIFTKDSRASRNHGRIERRRDKFVLVDQSTNGTYVTFEGEPELTLKREEIILRGRGAISFGHASGTEGVERLEFELLD